MVTNGNLFDVGLLDRTAGERIDALMERPGVSVERIVSLGHASAPGFWYDSPRDEWVVLLSGAARLEFDGDAPPRTLRPGDYLLIDAHRRHRVAWTHASEPTVWLAIYCAARGAVGSAADSAGA